MLQGDGVLEHCLYVCDEPVTDWYPDQKLYQVSVHHGRPGWMAYVACRLSRGSLFDCGKA